MSLGAAVLVVFLWQATTAALALNQARSVAGALSKAIATGDVPRARTLLTEFDDATTRAHHRTDGPLWKVGGTVPWVGRSIQAVSTVAAAVDDIADDALPKVVRVADQVRLDAFRPKNGRVDMAAVGRTVPVLAATSAVLERADRQVGAIEVNRLLALMRGSFGRVQEQVHAATAAVAAARDAGELLPTMLAADGTPRHYLLMVLNNAEIRSLVGMPGSYADLEASDGKVSIAQQKTPEEMAPLDDDQAAKVVREVDAGFNSRVGIDIRDTTIVPDFPRAAELAAAIGQERMDVDFDGVIAVDPVSLGYVLAAVGPIDIGGGMVINRSNAASTLLNGIYLRYPDDNTTQNNAFKNAARKSFNALVSGRGNSVLAVQALVRGVQERRIMVWSKHPDEQRRIQSGGLAGRLTDPKQPKRPQVGVFMTDIGSAKMSYYLRMGSRLQADACYRRGVQDLTLTTTVGSEAPQTSRRLPESIVGPGTWVKPGGMRFMTRIVAPPGGQIVSVSVDGTPAPVNGFRYLGRQITQVERVLFPAESSVIITKIRTAEGSTGDPLLHTTPGVVQNDDSVGATAC